MIKIKELCDDKSCFNRSEAEEPLFVLCARDRLAPEVVDVWATAAEAHGVNPEKVQSARQLAIDMRVWQTKNRTKLPD